MTPTITKEEIILEIWPHTCKDKIKELEEKLNHTADCLCDPYVREMRAKLLSSLSLLENQIRSETVGEILKIFEEQKSTAEECGVQEFAEDIESTIGDIKSYAKSHNIELQDNS